MSAQKMIPSEEDHELRSSYQTRENLAQLGNEVNSTSRHETRSIILSALAGAAFALVTSWVAFRVFS